MGRRVLYVGRMDRVVIRVGQRRKLLIWAGSCGGVIVAAVVAIVLAPHSPAALLALPGAVALVVGAITLDLALGRTVFTTHGLRTGALFLRKSCRWDEVASIQRVPIRSRGGGVEGTQLILQRHNGKKFTLRAPYDSDKGHDRDSPRDSARSRRTGRATLTRPRNQGRRQMNESIRGGSVVGSRRFCRLAFLRFPVGAKIQMMVLSGCSMDAKTIHTDQSLSIGGTLHQADKFGISAELGWPTGTFRQDVVRLLVRVAGMLYHRYSPCTDVRQTRNRRGNAHCRNPRADACGHGTTRYQR